MSGRVFCSLASMKNNLQFVKYVFGQPCFDIHSPHYTEMPPSVRHSRQGHACVSQAIGYKLYLIRFENFIWWPRDVLNNESESCFFLSCWDQVSKRVIPTVKLVSNGFFHHFKLTNIYLCVTRVNASCLNIRLQTLFNYIWELCIDA